MTEPVKQDPICIGMLTPDPLRLEGTRALLEADGAYQVVPLGIAGSDAVQVRLAMVDTASAMHLESLVRQMRRARPHIVILALGPDTGLEPIMAMIGFGVKGYLPYSATEKELRMALQVVQEGSIWAPRKVLAGLLAKKDAEPASTSRLTRREEEVLRLLVQGRPNRQIADALGLDEATIKAHLGRVMRKLGVANRTALSMRAMERLGHGTVSE